MSPDIPPGYSRTTSAPKTSGPPSLLTDQTRLLREGRHLLPEAHLPLFSRLLDPEPGDIEGRWEEQSRGEQAADDHRASLRSLPRRERASVGRRAGLPSRRSRSKSAIRVIWVWTIRVRVCRGRIGRTGNSTADDGTRRDAGGDAAPTSPVITASVAATADVDVAVDVDVAAVDVDVAAVHVGAAEVTAV